MSLTKTGTGWLESGQLKVGDKLVAVAVDFISPELTRGTIYEVFPSSGRSSLAIKTDKGILVNLGAYSITTFYKKESTMVDWSKPLEVVGWGPMLYVGTAAGGYAVVETTGGVLHKVDYKTGRMLSVGVRRSYTVTNVKEPWEVAYDQFENSMDSLTEKAYFKQVFELGRSWDR